MAYLYERLSDLLNYVKLFNILWKHIEQNLLSLSKSIERYQEICPQTSRLACIVEFLSIKVDIRNFSLVNIF